jgi:hypothetical protein
MGVSGGSVKVDGLNKTLTALQRAGVEVADLKAAMGAIAAEGARLASGFAPVRSGRLRNTIRGNKAKAKAVVIAGRAKVPYAGVINYGWNQPHAAAAASGWTRRNIKPSLFMQRADKALAPQAVKMLEAGIDKAIERAGLE